MPGVAFSQQLTLVSGKSQTGLVKDLTADGVVFMRMIKKPFDATDDVFKARSVQFSIEKYQYNEVKSVNGVPLKAYKVLYRDNPLYRLVEKIKYQWSVSMGKGSFVKQAKALFLFLLVLGVLVPLFVWGAGRITGSPQGFMGAIGMSIVIYGIGYGLLKGFEALTVSGVGFLQGSGGQMGALIGAVILIGVLIGVFTKESIISGLAMIAGWFLGIYAAIFAISKIKF